MEMGEYIKQLRNGLKLTQEELGQKLNPPVNRAAINKWEKGNVKNIKRSHIQQMAEIFGVSPVDLMCFDDVPAKPQNAVPVNDVVKIPLLGRVAAGEPLFDEGNIIGDVFVDPAMVPGDTQLFALKVQGDSMAPKIMDGDTLIVREQPCADSGEIVIVTINGDHGTCKKLQLYPDSMALVSLNPAYEPMIYTWEEVEQLPVKVVGKVIQARREI